MRTANRLPRLRPRELEELADAADKIVQVASLIQRAGVKWGDLAIVTLGDVEDAIRGVVTRSADTLARFLEKQGVTAADSGAEGDRGAESTEDGASAPGGEEVE